MMSIHRSLEENFPPCVEVPHTSVVTANIEGEKATAIRKGPAEVRRKSRKVVAYLTQVAQQCPYWIRASACAKILIECALGGPTIPVKKGCEGEPPGDFAALAFARTQLCAQCDYGD